MKKYLLFCLLASACNRTPDAQRLPVRIPAPRTMIADAAANARAAYITEMQMSGAAIRDDSVEVESMYATSPNGSMDSAYTVISDQNREHFTQRVNMQLDSGYYLRGPMRTERTGPHSFVFLQGLVRHRAGFGDY